MALEQKQYRIQKSAPGRGASEGYIVRVTWGLMDVRLVGFAPKLNGAGGARELAKTHAAKNKVEPIILT